MIVRDTAAQIKQLHRLPVTLKEHAQWMCFRLMPQPNGAKVKKRPVRAFNGEWGSINDDRDWCSFNEALLKIGQHGTDGIGIVLTKQIGLCAIDLDVPKGQTTLLARQLEIAKSFDTYIEWSQSGAGLHIICKATLDGDGRSRDDIECYDDARFLACTGNVWRDAPIVDYQEQALAIWKSLEKPKSIAKSSIQVEQSTSPQFTGGDFEVYRRASIAKNGPKFLRLWEGDISLHDGDWSRADQALINIIAFFSRDIEQTTRMFRTSVLGQRHKAERDDYVDKTVRKAFASLGQMPTQPLAKAVLLDGASVIMKPIDWLWHGYLARGKLHLLAGAPGAGKSTIACSLAAMLSSGSPLPDGTRLPPCNVLLWSSEDDIADTIAPRLSAMGADMAMINFIASADGKPWNPATDVAALDRACDDIGNIGLIVVDPITSAVLGDSHKATEVRNGLQPLVDLGMRRRIAIFGISHFSKGTSGKEPLERVIGSQAYGAFARIVYIASKREQDVNDGTRMFVRIKSNIGPDGDGFKYDMDFLKHPFNRDIVAAVIVWKGDLQGTARELLNDAERVEKEDDTPFAKSNAIRALQELLQNGPRPSLEIDSELRQRKITNYAFRQAKKQLGVVPTKDGLGKWSLSLPAKG